MARSKPSRGVCSFCGQEMSKGGMTRHLQACPQRLEAIQAADQGAGRRQTLYHLGVQAKYLHMFWLHLEMNGASSLEDLDHYLRAIWLECCDHLSRFSIGGWGSEKIVMSKRVDHVFQPGVELTHIYDFGTSSYTLVRAIAMREGKPLTRHPIVLMARNNCPEAVCMVCGQPASWLCIECLQETDDVGTLCDEHAKTHPHDDYGEPIPLVNSPRVGMCGYTGPAEPPY